MISLPQSPELPDLSAIFDSWDFTNAAFEITHFFQQLFSRLPPYFLSFFALMLAFIVIPLIIRMCMEIL